MSRSDMGRNRLSCRPLKPLMAPSSTILDACAASSRTTILSLFASAGWGQGPASQGAGEEGGEPLAARRPASIRGG